MKQHLVKVKTHFKEKGKVLLMTGAEVGVISGSMILTKKFLDFNEIFKDKIAADPKYAENFHIKHQGAIKVGAGLLAATYIKNPWLKMIAIGVALEGAITEIRVFAGKDDQGNDYIDKIGATNLDAQLEDLARNYDRQIHEPGVSGIVDQYGSGTAGIVDQYGSGTAGVGYRADAVYREFQ